LKFRLLLLLYTFLASLAGHALAGLASAMLSSEGFENLMYANLGTSLLVSVVIAISLTLTSQGLNRPVFFPLWRRFVFSMLVGIFAGLVLTVYLREELGLARIPAYVFGILATTTLALAASKGLLGYVLGKDSSRLSERGKG